MGTERESYPLYKARSYLEPRGRMGAQMMQSDDGTLEVNLSEFTFLLRAGGLRFALKLVQLNEPTYVLGGY